MILVLCPGELCCLAVFPPKYHPVCLVHFGLLVGVIFSVFVHVLYSNPVQSSLLMIISNSLVRAAMNFSFGLSSIGLKDG